jgi:hypothetical protein
VPITIYVQVVVTEPVLTLFASCTDSGTGPTTSYIPTQTTPPPTVYTTSSSSTMADGSVTVQLETITSSLSPTVVYVPTIMPTTQGSGGGNRLSTIAPIVGGVIGGFFGLISIVGLIWFFLYVSTSSLLCLSHLIHSGGDDEVGMIFSSQRIPSGQISFTIPTGNGVSKWILIPSPNHTIMGSLAKSTLPP